MPALVGLRALVRYPLDSFRIWGIKLLAWIRTIIWVRPQYLPLNAEKNELRMITVFPPLTSRRSEPIQCSVDHVSLDDYTNDYKSWLELEASREQAVPKKSQGILNKKLRDWWEHLIKHLKKADGWNQVARWKWGEYMALSYCWGDGKLRSNVIVNGQNFPVTKSLELALQAVRADQLTRGIPLPIKIWADFLCINQSDVDEKGVEINKMRSIYGRSMGVFVNLGEESEDSDIGINLIRRIAMGLRDGRDYRQDLFDLGIVLPSGTATAEQLEQQKAFRAMYRIFTRPYWSRMWIIQELAMGDDNITFACGNNMFAFHEIRQVLRTMVLNADSFSLIIGIDLLLEHQPKYKHTVAVLWWIGRMRELTNLAETRSDFSFAELRSPMLSLALSASATDDRDKVYGLLSLFPASLRAKIDRGPENYKMTTAEVYINFAKALIETTNELDVIYAASLTQSTTSKLNVPRWVPDWTLSWERVIGTDVSHDWYFGCEEGYEKSEQHQPLKLMRRWTVQSHRSDGGRKPTFRFSDGSRLLYCDVICIGTIDGLSPELDNGITVSASPKQTVQPTSTTSPYSSPTEVAEAITRTLLLNPSGDAAAVSTFLSYPWMGEEADADAENGTITFGEGTDSILTQLLEAGWKREHFLGNFSSFEALRRNLGLFRLGGKEFREYFVQGIQGPPEEVNTDELSILISNNVGHRVATLETGEVVMAPATAVSGDKVFVVVGCSMPVILRKDKEQDGCMEPVGECYVDGYMKGEVWADVDEEMRAVEEVVLC